MIARNAAANDSDTPLIEIQLIKVLRDEVSTNQLLDALKNRSRPVDLTSDTQNIYGHLKELSKFSGQFNSWIESQIRPFEAIKTTSKNEVNKPVPSNEQKIPINNLGAASASGNGNHFGSNASPTSPHSGSANSIGFTADSDLNDPSPAIARQTSMSSASQTAQDGPYTLRGVIIPDNSAIIATDPSHPLPVSLVTAETDLATLAAVRRMCAVWVSLVLNNHTPMTKAIPLLARFASLRPIIESSVVSLSQGSAGESAEVHHTFMHAIIIDVPDQEKFPTLLISSDGLLHFIAGCVEGLAPLLSGLGQRVASGFSKVPAVQLITPSVAEALRNVDQEAKGGSYAIEDVHFSLPDAFIKPFDDTMDCRHEYKSEEERSAYNEREVIFDAFRDLFGDFQQVSRSGFSKNEIDEFYRAKLLPLGKQILLTMQDCNFVWFADIFVKMLLFYGLNVPSASAPPNVPSASAPPTPKVAGGGLASSASSGMTTPVGTPQATPKSNKDNSRGGFWSQTSGGARAPTAFGASGSSSSATATAQMAFGSSKKQKQLDLRMGPGGIGTSQSAPRNFPSSGFNKNTTQASSAGGGGNNIGKNNKKNKKTSVTDPLDAVAAQFPGAQQFFFLFIYHLDSHRLCRHLEDTITAEIVSLSGCNYCNPASSGSSSGATASGGGSGYHGYNGYSGLPPGRTDSLNSPITASSTPFNAHDAYQDPVFRSNLGLGGTNLGLGGIGGTNGMISNNSTESFAFRTTKLRILGRFLGLLHFSPNWTLAVPVGSKGLLFERAAQAAENRHFHGTASLPLKEVIVNAWRDGCLSLNIPWIAEFLKMMAWDCTYPLKTNPYADSIGLLNSVMKNEVMQCSDRSRTLSANRLYVLIELQNLRASIDIDGFCAVPLPASLHQVVKNTSQSKSPSASYNSLSPTNSSIVSASRGNGLFMDLTDSDNAAVDDLSLAFSNSFLYHVTPFLNDALTTLSRRVNFAYHLSAYFVPTTSSTSAGTLPLSSSSSSPSGAMAPPPGLSNPPYISAVVVPETKRVAPQFISSFGDNYVFPSSPIVSRLSSSSSTSQFALGIAPFSSSSAAASAAVQSPVSIRGSVSTNSLTVGGGAAVNILTARKSGRSNATKGSTSKLAPQPGEEDTGSSTSIATKLEDRFLAVDGPQEYPAFSTVGAGSGCGSVSKYNGDRRSELTRTLSMSSTTGTVEQQDYGGENARKLRSSSISTNVSVVTSRPLELPRSLSMGSDLILDSPLNGGWTGTTTRSITDRLQNAFWQQPQNQILRLIGSFLIERLYYACHERLKQETVADGVRELLASNIKVVASATTLPAAIAFTSLSITGLDGDDAPSSSSSSSFGSVNSKTKRKIRVKITLEEFISLMSDERNRILETTVTAGVAVLDSVISLWLPSVLPQLCALHPCHNRVAKMAAWLIHKDVQLRREPLLAQHISYSKKKLAEVFDICVSDFQKNVDFASTRIAAVAPAITYPPAVGVQVVRLNPPQRSQIQSNINSSGSSSGSSSSSKRRHRWQELNQTVKKLAPLFTAFDGGSKAESENVVSGGGSASPWTSRAAEGSVVLDLTVRGAKTLFEGRIRVCCRSSDIPGTGTVAVVVHQAAAATNRTAAASAAAASIMYRNHLNRLTEAVHEFLAAFTAFISSSVPCSADGSVLPPDQWGAASTASAAADVTPDPSPPSPPAAPAAMSWAARAKGSAGGKNVTDSPAAPAVPAAAAEAVEDFSVTPKNAMHAMTNVRTLLFAVTEWLKARLENESDHELAGKVAIHMTQFYTAVLPFLTCLDAVALTLSQYSSSSSSNEVHSADDDMSRKKRQDALIPPSMPSDHTFISDDDGDDDDDDDMSRKKRQDALIPPMPSDALIALALGHGIPSSSLWRILQVNLRSSTVSYFASCKELLHLRECISPVVALFISRYFLYKDYASPNGVVAVSSSKAATSTAAASANASITSTRTILRAFSEISSSSICINDSEGGRNKISLSLLSENILQMFSDLLFPKEEEEEEEGGGGQEGGGYSHVCVHVRIRMRDVLPRIRERFLLVLEELEKTAGGKVMEIIRQSTVN